VEVRGKKDFDKIITSMIIYQDDAGDGEKSR
jgi:hypothetical protein